MPNLDSNPYPDPTLALALSLSLSPPLALTLAQVCRGVRVRRATHGQRRCGALARPLRLTKTSPGSARDLHEMGENVRFTLS